MKRAICARHSASSDASNRARAASSASAPRGTTHATTSSPHSAMPAADDGDLEHVGMAQQRFLDLARVDVRPAADDQVLAAVLERQEAAGVERADVAGMQPPAGERLRGRVRIAPVAAHHRRAAHPNLPVARRRGASTATLDAGLRDADRAQARVVAACDGVGDERAVHRGDRHRRFALAVDLGEPRAQRGERRLRVLHVHRSAAVDDRLQVRARERPDRRVLDEPLDHRGGGEEERAIPRADEAARLGRIESARFGNDVDRARATCGTAYRPEPCDSGAKCRIASPGAIASTSARKQRVIATRFACVISTPFGRPVVPLV